ncbi:hypothetical protein [Streptococcus ruminantium]|uniref:hypothetical protein n=1 Tax=Streptococcus ruminantium TaxID=1917441 RepID=UPI0012DECA18|nr:hypothetical protein [Streptococcus ruminantium]BDD37806.1 hypothetical protein GUT183_00440 [Streptococcus ruminantium]BDD39778.1 hypothetical protein GUT184_00420 [Streptococcus ruminantium]
MEYKTLQLTFEDFGDGKGLQLKSEELATTIDLENSETVDLKKFFDSVFEYIIENESVVQFELQNNTVKVLYQQVAEDFVSQINGEIKASEANFYEIINLKQEVS